MLWTICTLVVLTLGTAVNAQYGYCSGKYFICDLWRPCCGGGLDPLVCIPVRGYTSYCYPYSEYLAYVNSQKTTTTSSSKECAGLYQSCDFVSCCEDPQYPKYCSGTAQGKFCFLKQSVDTQTSASPAQTITSAALPTTASTPTNPTTASTPQNPTTASTPTNPTTASTPTNPTTASTPTNPTTASTPTNPTTTSTPTNPTTASTPTNPTKASTPTNPTTSSTPTNSTTASTPSTATTPTTASTAPQTNQGTP